MLYLLKFDLTDLIESFNIYRFPAAERCVRAVGRSRFDSTLTERFKI